MASLRSDTEFLDLAPEIVDRILAAYVDKAGVVEAWKNRRVCRAFSTCIMHNVLAKQPISAFLRVSPDNGRKLLKANMALYLKYRVKKLNGAHDFLPKFITGLLDQIESVTEVMDHATRTKNEKILCDTLVRNSPDVFLFLTTSASRKACQKKMYIFDDYNEENAITAAAAIGDIKALHMLFSAEGHGPLLYSRILGWPLAVAAYMGHLDIVKYIISNFKYPRAEYDDTAFTNAMSASLTARQVEVAKYLASVHPTYFSVVSKTPNAFTHALAGKLKIMTTYGEWLIRAITLRDVELVAAIMKMKHEGGVEIYVEGLRVACRVGCADMIRLFFEMDKLAINQRMGRASCETPMSIARSCKRFAAVRLLEDLGGHD